MFKLRVLVSYQTANLKHFFRLLLSFYVFSLQTTALIFRFLVDVVTKEEFKNLRTAGIEKYFLEMKKTHPKHRDRYSQQTWLPQRGTGDKMLRTIRRRYEIHSRCSVGGQSTENTRKNPQGATNHRSVNKLLQ